MQRDEETLSNENPSDGVAQAIHQLAKEQPFGILCTQARQQPYGSLVGFAFDQHLHSFVFATPQATRKHRILSECDQVALVVDSRSAFPDDFMRVSAFTATGKALRLSDGSDFDFWSKLLLQRHPYQREMVESASAAVFRIDVLRYFYVTRFQEVTQWVPPKP